MIQDPVAGQVPILRSGGRKVRASGDEDEADGYEPGVHALLVLVVSH
jgi:hypothetical protein